MTTPMSNEPNKHHHRIALERGLAEFDRVRIRKRIIRGTAAGLALCMVLFTIGFIAMRFTPGTGAGPDTSPDRIIAERRSLPSYVELILDDERLTVELELAGACERIGRTEGRFYVVECRAGGNGDAER